MRLKKPYRGSSLAAALMSAYSSFESIEVVDDGETKIIVWDIPDILLNLDQLKMSDISWCFRLFLWHFIGISLESSLFVFDAADEDFHQIEYENVLNFFVQRHASLYNQHTNTHILIPKASMRTIISNDCSTLQ